MDVEHREVHERTQYERDRDAWNLPAPQIHLVGPPLREWPVQDERRDPAGDSDLEPQPAA
jgi:hypothetical protein